VIRNQCTSDNIVRSFTIAEQIGSLYFRLHRLPMSVKPQKRTWKHWNLTYEKSTRNNEERLVSFERRTHVRSLINVRKSLNVVVQLLPPPMMSSHTNDRSWCHLLYWLRDYTVYFSCGLVWADWWLEQIDCSSNVTPSDAKMSFTLCKNMRHLFTGGRGLCILFFNLNQ
jgi:hypothetical protein